MKKIIAVAIAASLSANVFAGDSHNRYTGSVSNLHDDFVVTDAKEFFDLAKYADDKALAKLTFSYMADGKLTAAEIKASGIQDHHFYTGYLATAKDQADYDKRLKEMNGGNNVDDNYVSNRDMKAHGSMLMNQTDAKIKVQVEKLNNDLVAAGTVLNGQLRTMGEQFAQGLNTEIGNIISELEKTTEGLKELGQYVETGTTPEPSPEPTPTPNPELENKVEENTTNIQQNADKIQSNTNSIQQNTSAIQETNVKVSENSDKIAANTSAIQSNSDRIDVLESWKNNIDDRFSKMDKKFSDGVAGVAAMSNIPVPAVVGTTTIGAGIGAFGGSQAIAIGAAKYFENGVSIKASLSTAGHSNTTVVGAGMGYTF